MLTESELKWLRDRVDNIEKCCATCHVKRYQDEDEFLDVSDECYVTGYDRYCCRCKRYEGPRYSMRDIDYWNDDRQYEYLEYGYKRKKDWQRKPYKLLPDYKDAAEFDARAFELAVFFLADHAACESCAINSDCSHDCSPLSCEEFWLKWIRESVEREKDWWSDYCEKADKQ